MRFSRVSWALLGVAIFAVAGEPWALDGKREFDLQGHRGARGLAPENTLVAFTRALGIGVTTLELDLAVTQDGVVRVVPWTVNRPQDMEAMIDLGVDGMITDRPDLGRSALSKKGLVLPPPTEVRD